MNIRTGIGIMTTRIERHRCFTVQVWGDKDADGFYWGECRGRRGYVPHNMVVEVSEQDAGQAAATKPRDRWTESYANQPVRRMVALFDYDPQELSPNVDADVSDSVRTNF
jgi:RIMS-binding protein 2